MLIQIESETEKASEKSRETAKKMPDLTDRSGTLQQKFVENDLNVKKAEQEATIAEALANQAENVRIRGFMLKYSDHCDIL